MNYESTKLAEILSTVFEIDSIINEDFGLNLPQLNTQTKPVYQSFIETVQNTTITRNTNLIPLFNRYNELVASI